MEECIIDLENGDDFEVTSSVLDKNIDISDTAISKATVNYSVDLTEMPSITLDDDKIDMLKKNKKTDEKTSNISKQSTQINTVDYCTNESTETNVEIIETNVKSKETNVEENITINLTAEEDMLNVTDYADETDFFKSTLVELGRRIWMSSSEKQHYIKGCLWSPDGTCILVPVNLDGMHVIEVPQDLYTIKKASKDRELSPLNTAVHVKEGGTVYDLAWYPFMQSSSPDSCCWISTGQHEPIHMWDAFTGELRCSYRGYDLADEVEAAISVAFTTDGEKVLGGYKKSIKVFDVSTPGRDCHTVAVKKAVSCFATSSSNKNTVTCGSWNGYIDHYDLRSSNLGSLFTLGGHKGGITWLQYTKTDPLMLLSGARKDNDILFWDMRNYKEPISKFTRTVTTNQRIYFDLSPLQQYLASGDCSGIIHIWDLMNDTDKYEINVHNDCCNGVQFHPTLPVLASTSGQFHFPQTADEDENASTNSQTGNHREKTIIYENALIFLGIAQ